MICKDCRHKITDDWGNRCEVRIDYVGRGEVPSNCYCFARKACRPRMSLKDIIKLYD